MIENVDLGYKRAIKAVRTIGNMLSTSVGDQSSLLHDLDVGYATILDLGSSWAVSFYQGIEKNQDWWEEPENYAFSVTDKSFYKAVAKAYNLVVKELEKRQKYATACSGLLIILDK